MYIHIYIYTHINNKSTLKNKTILNFNKEKTKIF